MGRLLRLPYENEVAVLASMHAKERVIAPILRDELGLLVGLAMGVDTDQFGTFSRSIERKGSQLDAARAKIAAGFEYAPVARIGLASEGSFGPHPVVPLIAQAREIVLLIDKETGLELTGQDTTLDTNFGHVIAHDLDSAFAFAQSVGFPEHGLMVMGYSDDQPAHKLMLNKDVTTAAALESAVKQAILIYGAAFIETDMRAHRNPRRMKAIERATRDLVRRLQSHCPECGSPGFDVTERTSGLPCQVCGQPTRGTRAEVLNCATCGHRIERLNGTILKADAAQCRSCNP